MKCPISRYSFWLHPVLEIESFSMLKSRYLCQWILPPLGSIGNCVLNRRDILLKSSTKSMSSCGMPHRLGRTIAIAQVFLFRFTNNVLLLENKKLGYWSIYSSPLEENFLICKFPLVVDIQVLSNAPIHEKPEDATI